MRIVAVHCRLLDGTADALSSFIAAAGPAESLGASGTHGGRAAVPPAAATVCSGSTGRSLGTASHSMHSTGAAAAEPGSCAEAGPAACSACRTSSLCEEAACAVPRRQASMLSYDEFVRDYMAPNRPVIIQVRGKRCPAKRITPWQPGCCSCCIQRSRAQLMAADPQDLLATCTRLSAEHQRAVLPGQCSGTP